MSNQTGQAHFDHLAAQGTLNHIHAQIVAANLPEQSLQEVNHHFMGAKYHLQEMTHARASGLSQQHEMANDAYRGHLNNLMRALDNSNHPESNDLAFKVDTLLADSHALEGR
jgi:hypothetical protein